MLFGMGLVENSNMASESCASGMPVSSDWERWVGRMSADLNVIWNIPRREVYESVYRR